MRIENQVRIGASSGRTRTSGSGAAFQLDEGQSPQRAPGVAAPAPSAGIDALLALQAVEDPLLRRRKAVRRGTDLLDTLEEIAADLLIGRTSDSRLNQLMALIGLAREKSDPRLEALLDDIELRARVELAKRGLFPHVQGP